MNKLKSSMTLKGIDCSYNRRGDLATQILIIPTCDEFKQAVESQSGSAHNPPVAKK